MCGHRGSAGINIFPCDNGFTVTYLRRVPLGGGTGYPRPIGRPPPVEFSFKQTTLIAGSLEDAFSLIRTAVEAGEIANEEDMQQGMLGVGPLPYA